VALLLNIIAQLFETSMQIVAGRRWDKSQPLLTDLGFDLLPFFQQKEFKLFFIDTPIGAVIICTIAAVIFFKKDFFTESKMVIFRRYFIVNAIICILRACSVVFTISPEPYQYCSNFKIDTELSLLENIWIKFNENLKGENPFDCGDVFFSGHMARLTTAAMLWTTYTKVLVHKIIVWIFVIFAGLSIISARYHYTNDVIFGVLLGVTFWNWYHGLSSNHNALKKIQSTCMV